MTYDTTALTVLKIRAQGAAECATLLYWNSDSDFHKSQLDDALDLLEAAISDVHQAFEDQAKAQQE